MSRLFILTYCAVGFFDSCQWVLCGVLRGLGLVNKIVTVYGVIYYVIMLPCAILLAFTLHLGAEGLWLSLFVGTGCVNLVLCVLLMTLDYDALIVATREVTNVMQEVMDTPEQSNTAA